MTPAEEAVFGAVVSDDSCYPRICGLITSRDFSDNFGGLIWQAVTKLGDAKKPIDLVTLVDVLVKDNIIPSDKTISDVSNIFNSVPDPSSIEHYAAIVRRDSRHRALVKMQQNLGLMIERGDQDEQIIDWIGTERQSLLSSGIQDVIPIGELMKRTLASMEKQLHEGKVGLMTGYTDFDQIVGGLKDSEMVVLAARPGVGKTTFALNTAVNIAWGGKSVAFFSAEMSDEALCRRLIANKSGLENIKIQSSRIYGREWDDVVAASDLIVEKKLWIDATQPMTVPVIRSKSHALKYRHSLDLIVVDYVQLIESFGETREREVANVSNGLKSLAMELKVPVLACAQLNRAVEHRQDPEPTLADLRDSGEIEQGADVVVIVHTKDRGGDAQPIHCVVAKHRNGPTGRFRLVYLPKKMKYRDYVWPNESA